MNLANLFSQFEVGAGIGDAIRKGQEMRNDLYRSRKSLEHKRSMIDRQAQLEKGRILARAGTSGGTSPYGEIEARGIVERAEFDKWELREEEKVMKHDVTSSRRTLLTEAIMPVGLNKDWGLIPKIWDSLEKTTAKKETPSSLLKT